MMDQAADIAIFAVMTAVAPLLLSITVYLNAPLASHQNNDNFTAYITSIAACSAPVPLPAVTPT